MTCASESDPFRVKDHFATFVLSFHHGYGPETREDFIRRAYEMGWRSWLCGYRGEGEVGFLLGGLRRNFHPPTLEALFPEIYRVERCTDYYQEICPHRNQNRECPPAPVACRTELIKKLSDLSIESAKSWSDLLADSDPEDTLRLSLDLEAAEFPSGWRYTFNYWDGIKEQEGSYPVRIDHVEAYLFPYQVGFFCIKTVLMADFAYGRQEFRPEELACFWGKFREFDETATLIPVGRRPCHHSPAGVEGAEHKPSHEAFDYWLQPLKALADPVEKATTLITERAFRFKVFSFVSLDKDVAKGTPIEEWWEETIKLPSYYEGLSRVDMLLYELATTTIPGTWAAEDPSCQAWHPSRVYLEEELFTKNLVSIWRFWKGLALKDLVVFLSAPGEKFPRTERYHETFFPLYIYVYNLKLQLFRLSTELNLRHLRGDDKEIRKIIEDFFIFRNEFWFSEISPNFQMAILFDKFKWGLELGVDYEGVQAEVNDMFNYLETQFTHRLNHWVVALTIGALTVGFYGMNTIPIDDNSTLSKFLTNDAVTFAQLVFHGLTGAAIIGLSWLVYTSIKRWKRARKRRQQKQH